MKPGLQRTALVEFIRYLGAAQAGPVVVLHGAWMLLALAVFHHASASAGGAGAEVTRTILRAYAWLGGTDGNGVGNGANVIAVWGKISVVLYLIETLARRAIGPRAPMRLRVLALASGGIALLGYGASFLGAAGGSDTTGLILLSLLFALLAAAAAAWAVLARRTAEAVVRRIEVTESSPPLKA